MIMRTKFCGEILLIRESRGSKMTRPLDQKFCKDARKTWPKELRIVYLVFVSLSLVLA